MKALHLSPSQHPCALYLLYCNSEGSLQKIISSRKPRITPTHPSLISALRPMQASLQCACEALLPTAIIIAINLGVIQKYKLLFWKILIHQLGGSRNPCIYKTTEMILRTSQLWVNNTSSLVSVLLCGQRVLLSGYLTLPSGQHVLLSLPGQ